MERVSSRNSQLLQMKTRAADRAKPRARRTPAITPADVLLTVRPLLLLKDEGKIRNLHGKGQLLGWRFRVWKTLRNHDHPGGQGGGCFPVPSCPIFLIVKVYQSSSRPPLGQWSRTPCGTSPRGPHYWSSNILQRLWQDLESHTRPRQKEVFINC